MNWDAHSDPVEISPSAEDEYLASLEPHVDYTGELILAMWTLTEKQRFVIGRKFGLYGGPEMSTCQIAAMMGISHVSVVRLEQRAMRKLRKGLRKSSIFSDSYGPSVNEMRA